MSSVLAETVTQLSLPSMQYSSSLQLVSGQPYMIEVVFVKLSIYGTNVVCYGLVTADTILSTRKVKQFNSK